VENKSAHSMRKKKLEEEVEPREIDLSSINLFIKEFTLISILVTFNFFFLIFTYFISSFIFDNSNKSIIFFLNCVHL
jgi:hypothetical protein